MPPYSALALRIRLQGVLNSRNFWRVSRVASPDSVRQFSSHGSTPRDIAINSTPKQWIDTGKYLNVLTIEELEELSVKWCASVSEAIPAAKIASNMRAAPKAMGVRYQSMYSNEYANETSANGQYMDNSAMVGYETEANSLLRRAGELNDVVLCDLLWKTMLTHGITPQGPAIHAWLRALLRAKDYERARSTLDAALVAGLRPTQLTLTLALEACGATLHNSPAVSIALHTPFSPGSTLDAMSSPQGKDLDSENLFSSSSSVSIEKANHYWSILTRGSYKPPRPPITPNYPAYIAYLDVASRGGDSQRAVQLLERLQKENYTLNATMFALAMHACAGAANPFTAFSLFDRMLNLRIAPNAHVWDALARVVAAAPHARDREDLDVELRRYYRLCGNTSGQALPSINSKAMEVAHDASNSNALMSPNSRQGSGFVLPLSLSTYAALIQAAEMDNDFERAYTLLQEYRQSLENKPAEFFRKTSSSELFLPYEMALACITSQIPVERDMLGVAEALYEQALNDCANYSSLASDTSSPLLPPPSLPVALVQAYALAGHLDSALSLYYSLFSGIAPATLSPLNEDPDELFAQIPESELPEEFASAAKEAAIAIIRLAGAFGDLQAGKTAFFVLMRRGVLLDQPVFEALAAAAASAGQAEAAVAVIPLLEQSAVAGNARIYCSILEACLAPLAQQLDLAEYTLTSMRDAGIHPTPEILALIESVDPAAVERYLAANAPDSAQDARAAGIGTPASTSSRNSGARRRLRRVGRSGPMDGAPVVPTFEGIASSAGHNALEEEMDRLWQKRASAVARGARPARSSSLEEDDLDASTDAADKAFWDEVENNAESTVLSKSYDSDEKVDPFAALQQDKSESRTLSVLEQKEMQDLRNYVQEPALQGRKRRPVTAVSFSGVSEKEMLSAVDANQEESLASLINSVPESSSRTSNRRVTSEQDYEDSSGLESEREISKADEQSVLDQFRSAVPTLFVTTASFNAPIDSTPDHAVFVSPQYLQAAAALGVSLDGIDNALLPQSHVFEPEFLDLHKQNKNDGSRRFEKEETEETDEFLNTLHRASDGALAYDGDVPFMPHLTADMPYDSDEESDPMKQRFKDGTILATKKDMRAIGVKGPTKRMSVKTIKEYAKASAARAANRY